MYRNLMKTCVHIPLELICIVNQRLLGQLVRFKILTITTAMNEDSIYERLHNLSFLQK